mmetsp:Transcript_3609/g.7974  ORF Transcript_3609/g.7974 Transcript_3609/m.7974 type:complete len:123 (+) Transcript_3609:77-445(+)
MNQSRWTNPMWCNIPCVTLTTLLAMQTVINGDRRLRTFVPFAQRTQQRTIDIDIDIDTGNRVPLTHSPTSLCYASVSSLFPYNGNPSSPAPSSSPGSIMSRMLKTKLYADVVMFKRTAGVIF